MKSIIRKVIVLSFTLIVFCCKSDDRHAREIPIAVTEVAGVSIGDNVTDVRFKFGKESQLNDTGYWWYYSLDFFPAPEAIDAEQIRVYIEKSNAKVLAIEAIGNKRPPFFPEDQTQPPSSSDLVDIYGEPDYINDVEGGLQRVYGYEDLNLMILLQEDEVVGWLVGAQIFVRVNNPEIVPPKEESKR